jgi:hypothetical protein
VPPIRISILLIIGTAKPIGAAQLGAQASNAQDTVAIRGAAAKKGESTARVRIVADTAWVRGLRSKHKHVKESMATAWRLQESPSLVPHCLATHARAGFEPR